MKLPQASHGERVKHPRMQRRVVHILSLSLVGVLAFAASGFGAVYYKFQNNITSADVSNLLGAERPTKQTPDPDDPNAGEPLTFLLMGSDDRSGENEAIGGKEEGMRSDTTLVMHISGDRSRVEFVSIPRDSIVDLPTCETTGGTVLPARKKQQFNSAFSRGWNQGKDLDSAAACTIKTVESLTNVRIDRFVIVDFAGFQRMIDAINGVPMCVSEDLKDIDAGLDVKAGYRVFDGATALAFVRARHGLGDGSDTQRIVRQQQFLAEVANSVLSKNILTNAPELLAFLDAATESITTDPQTASIRNLTGLGLSLKDIQPSKISFMTVPSGPHPQNPNRVIWHDEADEVWERMADDQPIQDSEPEPTTSATPSTTQDPTQSSAPATTTDPETTVIVDPKDGFTAADKTTDCTLPQ